MKGFVPTPPTVVDRMIAKLFGASPPSPDASVLDPGAGEGAFIDGLLRWCSLNGRELPRITAVESNPVHVEFLRARFAGISRISVVEADFLTADLQGFDFVVGNPPYVSITDLSSAERTLYRQGFTTAHGRFDLYILFFERALRLLNAGGKLVFITPEKYLYVETASPLRELISRHRLEELDFVDEDTFPGLVTYPLITTIRIAPAETEIGVVDRDGRQRRIPWKASGSSWLPLINESRPHVTVGGLTLGDVCRRVSCGVATGADSVFVVSNARLPATLRPYAHPTLAGREIVGCELPAVTRSMLVPYAEDGSLRPAEELGALLDYLSEPARREKLLARTCARRKPWYAFHETPPLRDILNPKILCKDIAASPTFVVDGDGAIVPRHTVYYIVPKVDESLEPLHEYLTSPAARRWLEDHSQRAARGFVRMQSHVLKHLPVPSELAVEPDQISMAYEQSLPRTA